MSPPRVAILDYGCGNLGSVVNAVRKVGGEPLIVDGHTRGAMHSGSTTHIILPGQGAFCELGERWRASLQHERQHGKPILGICLGMQLMCEGSEEAPGVKGLGWIKATCERLPLQPLPHVGWNTVPGPGMGDFYFCHSYGVLMDAFFDRDLEGPDFTAHWTNGTDDPATRFLSAAFKDNLWAVQFHPEKSGKAGLDLLREFLRL